MAHGSTWFNVQSLTVETLLLLLLLLLMMMIHPSPRCSAAG
jgi:hypothetical protein